MEDAGVPDKKAVNLQPQYEYPGLNVQKYVNAYSSRGRINRLMLIVDHIPAHAQTAMFEAIAEVQHCRKDDELYVRVFKRAKEMLGEANEACQYDELLLEQSRKAVREESTRLDGEVQRWRNLNKDENARLAYVELATHFEAQGKFETALAKYLEAYDFADNHFQQIQLRILICKAAVLGNKWMQIKTYAPTILESTEFRSQINQFKEQQGVLMICLGLYYLHKRAYHDAARLFVENPCLKISEHFRDIISDEHIGLYGALCAVVAYNRGQFESRVIRNKVFQSYLQQSPKGLRLVESYYNSQYADVTKALKDLEIDLRIDLYLKDQCNEILSAVRGKAMVQFFSPFSAMGMNRMAEAFGVTVKELESELVTCIAQGHINAKIDSHNKVVEAVDPDEEGDLFRDINLKGRKWTRETKAMLLRMSMIRHTVDLNQQRGGDFGDAQEGDSFPVPHMLGQLMRGRRGMF